jgi:hypothetical protein
VDPVLLLDFIRFLQLLLQLGDLEIFLVDLFLGVRLVGIP